MCRLIHAWEHMCVSYDAHVHSLNKTNMHLKLDTFALLETYMISYSNAHVYKAKCITSVQINVHRGAELEMDRISGFSRKIVVATRTKTRNAPKPRHAWFFGDICGRFQYPEREISDFPRGPKCCFAGLCAHAWHRSPPGTRFFCKASKNRDTFKSAPPFKDEAGEYHMTDSDRSGNRSHRWIGDGSHGTLTCTQSQEPWGIVGELGSLWLAAN